MVPIAPCMWAGRTPSMWTETWSDRATWRLQAEQVARNLQAALEAAGATLDDVVKLTIYLVEPHSAFPAYGAFQRVWGMPATAPTISLLYVSGLFQPDFLLEVDAVAVVAE